MSESQYLSVIRIWAALAWADGVIAEAEATAMKKLIDLARLSDAEREVALGWLERRVELDGAGDLTGLGEDARLGIYRAAWRLAAVDLHVADEERRFLGRLRERLGIEARAADAIEAAMSELAPGR